MNVHDGQPTFEQAQNARAVRLKGYEGWHPVQTLLTQRGNEPRQEEIHLGEYADLYRFDALAERIEAWVD